MDGKLDAAALREHESGSSGGSGVQKRTSSGEESRIAEGFCYTCTKGGCRGVVGVRDAEG